MLFQMLTIRLKNLNRIIEEIQKEIFGNQKFNVKQKRIGES